MTSDVIVVGAGPAGATAACALAQAGLRVLLLEKAPGPKHKVCGEFLSPGLWPLMDHLGLTPDLAAWNLPIMTCVELTAGGRRLHRPLPGVDGRHAFGLSRCRLDERLVQRAISLGASVRRPVLVRRLIERDGHVVGVRADTPDQGEVDLLAPTVVVADGKMIGLGLPAEDVRRSGQLGVKVHLRGVADRPEAAIELHSFSGGYVGLSPIEDGLFNTCCAVSVERYAAVGNDPQRLFAAMRADNPLYAERTAGAEPAIDWQVCPLPRYTLRPPALVGLHRIGNAAGAFDPFVGEGIFSAMTGGWLLGRMLARHGCAPEAWPAVNAALRAQLAELLAPRYHSGRVFAAVACRPTLSAVALAVLACLPGVVDRAVRWSGKRPIVDAPAPQALSA